MEAEWRRGVKGKTKNLEPWWSPFHNHHGNDTMTGACSHSGLRAHSPISNLRQVPSPSTWKFGGVGTGACAEEGGRRRRKTRMLLSFSGFKGYFCPSPQKKEEIKVCTCVVQQDSRPLSGVSNDFPSTAPGNLPPLPVYSQRKIDL